MNEVSAINFDISAVEHQRAQHWIKYHGKGDSPCRHEKGPRIQYRFVRTGAGVQVVVACLRCRQTLDVSEYESWLA